MDLLHNISDIIYQEQNYRRSRRRPPLLRQVGIAIIVITRSGNVFRLRPDQRCIFVEYRLAQWVYYYLMASQNNKKESLQRINVALHYVHHTFYSNGTQRFCVKLCIIRYNLSITNRNNWNIGWRYKYKRVSIK